MGRLYSPDEQPAATEAGDAPWMGRRRASMATNCLIARAELGKPRKTQFAAPDPDHVFGLKMPGDPEGAKQVTMQWREHEPNSHAKPGPDFKAMNRLAADSGLASTQGLREFRAAHPVSLRCGTQAVASRAPPLPSEKDPGFTYGRPVGYRSAEDVRNCGPNDPPLRSLIQGAFAREWVDMNAARADELDSRAGYIKPAPTKATEGHARGSAAARAAPGDGAGWKMGRFTRHAAPRVTAYMRGGSGGGGSPVNGGRGGGSGEEPAVGDADYDGCEFAEGEEGGEC